MDISSWSLLPLLILIWIQLRTLLAQITPSGDCIAVQNECHKDTDCLHRAIYLHSTCVTGTCQPQCKTAVLNLYQTKPGRKLLNTDLSCLASVKPEMEKCALLPTRSPMHCTLARFVCQANPNCSQHLDIYEAKCSITTGRGECDQECENLLSRVLGGAGSHLDSCICWSHDPLCTHFRKILLNPCVRPNGSDNRSDKNEKNRLPKPDAVNPPVTTPSSASFSSASFLPILFLQYFNLLLLSSGLW